jgi:hypothetical protein
LQRMFFPLSYSSSHEQLESLKTGQLENAL